MLFENAAWVSRRCCFETNTINHIVYELLGFTFILWDFLLVFLFDFLFLWFFVPFFFFCVERCFFFSPSFLGSSLFFFFFFNSSIVIVFSKLLTNCSAFSRKRCFSVKFLPILSMNSCCFSFVILLVNSLCNSLATVFNSLTFDLTISTTSSD